jgi:hypothetical protein
MNRRVLTCAAALCCAASFQARAQTPAEQPRAQVKRSSAARPAAGAEADPLAEARRAAAVSLVLSLAGEARDYKDASLRVRVQARAADALWEGDAVAARGLFYRAWESAEAVDKEGEARAEEARRKFLSGAGGVGMIPPAPNLRAEVLRLAARRDRALGEELLAKLEEEKDAREKSSPYADPTDLPPAVAKRLELAVQLLEAGDLQRATLTAEPALARATPQGVTFLILLRRRDAAAADRRFAEMLARAADDPAADATSVSLLSSYVFTPSVLVTVTRRGSITNRSERPATTPALTPETRAAFFRAAAQILLRPTPPPEQDHTSAGREGTYFTIARLLPLFERHAPAHVPQLRAKLAALAPDLPEANRSWSDSMLTAGFSSAQPAQDEVEEALGRAGRASGASDRDRIYLTAVRAAVAKGDPRARELACKVEDAELRARALAFVDFVAVRAALGRRDSEEALRLARAGDLTHTQRVWAYTEVSSLLTKADPRRAAELLDEAAAESRRVGDATPELAQALTAVSARLFDVDRARSWELAAEAVKAANKAADFEGEGGAVTARLQTRYMIAAADAPAPSFDLAGLFGLLARDDFYRAFNLAGGLVGESPRATAQLAVARSALVKK